MRARDRRKVRISIPLSNGARAIRRTEINPNNGTLKDVHIENDNMIGRVSDVANVKASHTFSKEISDRFADIARGLANQKNCEIIANKTGNKMTVLQAPFYISNLNNRVETFEVKSSLPFQMFEMQDMPLDLSSRGSGRSVNHGQLLSMSSDTASPCETLDEALNLSVKRPTGSAQEKTRNESFTIRNTPELVDLSTYQNRFWTPPFGSESGDQVARQHHRLSHVSFKHRYYIH